MTPLPASPFMTSAADPIPAADRAVVSASTPEATARFDRYFDPVKFLRDIAVGLPGMSAKGFAAVMGEDEPPAFIGDPSIAFSTMIADIERDLRPMLEDYVRRAG